MCVCVCVCVCTCNPWLFDVLRGENIYFRCFSTEVIIYCFFITISEYFLMIWNDISEKNCLTTVDYFQVQLSGGQLQLEEVFILKYTGLRKYRNE